MMKRLLGFARNSSQVIDFIFQEVTDLIGPRPSPVVDDQHILLYIVEKRL